MKIELFTTTVEDLIQKSADIYALVYDSFSMGSDYYSNENYDKLYEEYVKYTQEYSTGSCYFIDAFKKKLPNVDKLMRHIILDYDSIVLEQEGKYVTAYIDLKVNIKLFTQL